jgi:xylulokinase
VAIRYLLGVDIGTYSSKAVLVKESGEVAASASVEHALSLPKPGHVEHDAEQVWWADFRALARELLSCSGVDPRRIAGIGISTISPAVVPVDERGIALRPAILYGIDTRATREIEELHALTGAPLSSQSASPKVLWIRRNEPEVWARTRRIVNGCGYLVLRLTGESSIDVYDATLFAPFFDAAALAWSPELAPHVAPVEMMPRALWTCEVAGRVTAEAARETGLAAGTPVITGTADAAAEAISAGLTEAGDLMVMYGSSTFFILRTPELRAPANFWGTRFLEKDTYAVAGGTATAGSLTRWFRDNFAGTEIEAERAGGINAYEALAGLAATSPPGSRGLVVLPYFAGERTPLHDPEAKGMVFGLGLSHTRADLYRAILEAVGYSIRHNIEALAEQGCRAQRILAVGGGTRNTAWMQMVSDIAGITQVIPEQQIGASYGDAFLAGVGVGRFSGTQEIRRWVRPRGTLRPDAGAHAVYDGYYRIYRELYNRNAGTMHALGALARGSTAPT